MQMIDVLKRLAELDANNSNVVYETKVSECGPMAMGGMEMPVVEEPKTPATLNITAGDGEELGNMLAAIMQLAGLNKVEPEQLGVEHEPTVMTSAPAMSVGATPADAERDSMRSVLDKMNDIDGNEGGKEDDQEETDEGEERDQHGIPGVDTTPNDPTKQKPFNPNGFTNHENQPGGGDVPKDHESRPRDRNQPTATMEERLMAEYKQFMNE